MKNKIIISLVIIIALVSAAVSCTVSKKVQDKEGSELWSENCGRCHNAPGASNYSAQHWEIIGTHMRMRAHITAVETKKIVEFLQSSSK